MAYPVAVRRYPSLDYAAAWRWQTEAAAAVRAGADEALLLLQHPPVYTFGRRVRREHLLVDAEALRQRGADLVESDRGGDITFHGPGQLVAYPTLDLRRRGLGPVDYVRALEETLVRALACFGLRGERITGRPGVWVDGAKVAAIGVRVQGGVTTHGFALNVDTDLSWFEAIVPCGLSDARVTSMTRLLGRSPGLGAVEVAVIAAFSSVFDAELVESHETQHGTGVQPLTRSLRACPEPSEGGVPSETLFLVGRSRQSPAPGAGLQDAESRTRELVLGGR